MRLWLAEKLGRLTVLSGVGVSELLNTTANLFGCPPLPSFGKDPIRYELVAHGETSEAFSRS